MRKDETPQESIIFPDSPLAAQRVTVETWRSRTGHLWGEDERAARYDGATHFLCAGGCNTPLRRNGYTTCESCREAQSFAEYDAAPRRKWDGIGMLYSDSKNKFFSDAEELDEYCQFNNTDPKALRIYLCEANYGRVLDGDFLCDDLPTDDQEVPHEIAVAMDAFNAVVKAYGPLCWRPSKFAAELPIHPESEGNQPTVNEEAL